MDCDRAAREKVINGRKENEKGNKCMSRYGKEMSGRESRKGHVGIKRKQCGRDRRR